MRRRSLSRRVILATFREESAGGVWGGGGEHLILSKNIYSL